MSIELHKELAGLSNCCNRWSIRLLLITFSLLYTISSFAQIELQWSKNFGGDKSDIANTIYPTGDGGCLLAGHSFSNNGDLSNTEGESDIWLAKITNTGTLQWKKTIGGSRFDQAIDLIRTGDGGFVLLSNSKSDDYFDIKGGLDCVLTKINANGTVLWEHTYGGLGNDVGKSLISNGLQGFFIVGNSDSDFSNNSKKLQVDAWLSKIDNQGNLLWNKAYGGSQADFFEKILRQDNGNLIAIGHSFSRNGNLSANQGLSDAWLIQFNNNGDVLWSKNYGGSENDFLKSILINEQNEILALGTSNSEDGDIVSPKGGQDVWLIKTDLNGNLLTSKNYGGCFNEEGIVLLEKEDNLMILGNTNASEGDFKVENGKTDVFVVELDTNNEVKSKQTLGGSNFEGIKAAQINSDANLFIAGFSMSNDGDLFGNKGQEDFWLLKTKNESQPEPEPNTTIVNLGEDVAICAGNSVEIDASSQCTTCTFLWEDGETDPLRIFSPIESTEYLITITDSNQSTTIGTVFIEILEPIQVEIITTAISCNSYSDGILNLEIEGGDGNYTVQWSNGSSALELQNVSSDIYQVTVSDGANCVATEGTILLNPPVLAMDGQVAIVACTGDATGAINTQVTGGNPPYSFEWSNGQNSQNIDAIAAGNYTLTLTDQSNCALQKSFIVSEYSPLGSLESTINPDLEQSNGKIELLPYGGKSPYAVEWNTGQEGMVLNQLSAGIYSYTLTDFNACEYTNSIAIGELTNISEVEQEKVTVFPNPSQGIFSIIVESLGEIKIFATNGQLLYQTKLSTLQSEISVEGFAKGIYFLQYKNKQTTHVQKLVIE